MTVETPDLQLARTLSKAQDLYPEHTYKAVVKRVYREQETVEGRVEMLEGLVAEFERGMVAKEVNSESKRFSEEVNSALEGAAGRQG